MDRDSALTRQELLACMELGKALTAELDSAQLFETILQKMSALLPAENWSLLLLDEATDELRFELSVNLDSELIKDVRLRSGEGIAGQVALQQKAMVVADVEGSGVFSNKVDRLTGFSTKSVMCMPLIFGGRTLGVLELVNPRRLDDGALALLQLIAEYTAIAVENMHRYQYIQTLAVQDNLTGLYNTRYLYQDLPKLLEASQAGNEPFSLIFLDIDDFKNVVDTYGHLRGSRALQEAAAKIRNCLNEPAYGVSYGGDEFVVVLPGFDKAQAVHKAEEIRSGLSRTVFLSGEGYHVNLRASFGVATYPDDSTDWQGLLALADQAMFDIKGKGKDGVGSG